MLDLRVGGWIGALASPLTMNIVDLHIVPGSAGPVLTSVTGAGGGLVRYALSQGGLPVPVDEVYFPNLPIGALSGGLSLLELGAQSLLLVGAADGNALWGYTATVSGGIGAQTQISMTATGGPGISGLYVAAAGYVYAAMADGQGIGVYAPDGLGNLAEVSRVLDGDDSHVLDLAEMTSIRFSENDFVVAASGSETGLSSYSVDPGTGALTLRGVIGTENGLGLLPAITAIEAVTVQGNAYVLVASSSTTGEMGALSVLRLTPTGELVATDHVLDTLNTRFGQVQSVATLAVNGLTYVIAGGGDDGISVLALLPHGRLVHLASLADSNLTGLQNISAISAVQIGDEVQILVAGQGEAGITQLSFSVANSGSVFIAAPAAGDLSGSAGDDLLSGNAGIDRISGGTGDDILFDGAGQDTLTGGAGADLFVLDADGAVDRIADFNVVQDRLDLTALPFLYDPTFLNITRTSFGAAIEWRGEQLELYSHDSTPLERAAVLASIQNGPDRPLLLVQRNIKGTNGNDTITGHAGKDVIEAFSGDDLIFSYDSGDRLLGGAGQDTLDSGAGDDTVDGGDGSDLARLGSGNDTYQDSAESGAFGQDTILAGNGNDTVNGGGGDDVIYGQDGHDVLTGGAGNDLLVGGGQFDTLYAGDGNDVVDGGNGRDVAYLGTGDDIFDDNDQTGYYGADTIYAGDGNDTVNGGGGDDVIYGNWHNDLLIGREGNDSLFGGRHDDKLFGGDGDDWIDGGLGRDLAYLEAGNDTYVDSDQSDIYGRDTVFGGQGNDTIDAGGGDDQLNGGAGADVFVFRVAAGNRRITDFTPDVDVLSVAKPSASVTFDDTPDGLFLSWQDGSVLLEGLVSAQIGDQDFIFL